MAEIEILETIGNWRLEHLKGSKIFFVCRNNETEVEGTYRECKEFFDKYVKKKHKSNAITVAYTVGYFAGCVGGYMVTKKIVDAIFGR